jgi:glycosidase
VDEACADIECDEWEFCENGSCHVKQGRCSENSDCQSNKCNMETHKCEYTGPCEGITCNNHGECKEGAGYGSGYGSSYGSGSSYQSDGIYCDCENGYRPENVGETPTCVNENCSLECGDNSYCDIDGSGNEYCKCIDGFEKDENDNCIEEQIIEPCDLDCGFGSCVFDESGAKQCECPEGYLNEDNDPTKQCIEDKCANVNCKDWQECKPADGSCIVVYPNCDYDNDCNSGEVCDLADHKCVEDKCKNVNCGNSGVCTVESGKAVCNCPHGYYDNNTKCVEITSQHPGWVGVQWPFTINRMKNDSESDMVYGRIYLEGTTGCPLSSHPQQNSWKAQLGYREGTGSAEYPVIAGKWKWIDANFNSGYDCADGNQNHEYMIPFPTDKAGSFIYIFRFSLDNGATWWYGDKGIGPDNNDQPGPRFIESESNHPGKATIEDTPATLLTLDIPEKTKNSYTLKLSYHGAIPIDFGASVITLNSVETNDYEYDETTKTFTISQTGLEPDKYSWLFRLVDENGNKIDPIFVPLWIGEGVDYADFGWRDAFIYQIMTDRFLNGDESNDVGSLSGVTIDLEQWKGGDFEGIIKKIDDGYFTDMGVNAIWISTPVLNPHHTSQGGTSSSQSNVYFTSYHAYHPLATGYSFDETYGYENEGVDTAFGTADKLRELVKKAHKKGIRVIPDFVVNHVYIEAELYKQHKNDGWFYPQNSCADQNWADNVIKNCWFTPYMPDFNYNNAEARKAVIAHAIWLIQNFNLDGFRADALKHIDDIFVKELRSAIKKNIETTVTNHDMPDEAEVFYMVGESLGGDWARYHTRADMVQGQVNDKLYYAIRDNILHGGSYSTLAGRIMNDANGDVTDTAFLTPKAAQGGTGGFPGAVMGNFFGNHDQDRALSECNGNYTLLKHAQTFLLTTPINIPMLYQGDDIGMTGRAENGFDGGRRAVMKFTGLSNDEKDALKHVQRLGKFRKAHPALRHGTRSTCASTNDAWVYKFKYEGDTVIVGINKGSSAYTATCSGESGTFYSYDGSSQQISNGSVTVPAGGSLVIGK